jgi:predicted Zn-dependent protease
LLTATPEKHSSMVFNISNWLLRLSETNRSDLELISQALFKCKMYSELINILGPNEKQLDGSLAVCYLKSLYYRGDIIKFKELLARYALQKFEDKELELIQWAYAVGWGTRSEALDAKKKLEEAAESKKYNGLPDRLLLQIAFQSSDYPLCNRALERLSNARTDLLSDHITYWRLLLALGKQKEVVDLTKISNLPPNTPNDAIDLATVFAQSGQTNQALQTLAWHLDNIGFNERVGFLYAELLAQTKDWQTLNTFILKIRGLSQLTQSELMWTYYEEGLVALGANQRDLADKVFTKAVEIGGDDPTLGMSIANKLLRLGFSQQALALMNKFEQRFQGSPEFWVASCMAASEAKNIEAMEKSAKKAYELAPNDLVIMNNYAAVLLAQRDKPTEAIKLTMQLITQMPEHPVFKINHAEALVANGRFSEAEKTLNSVPVERLIPSELQQYFYVQLQLLVNTSRWKEAREIVDKIDEQTLLPTQLKWFKESQQKIAQKTGRS